MIWSISGYKQFNKCQRQWYYSNIVADGRVKNDSYRKEVTILSRLQTIEAWRGSIVDDIISRLLVNAINSKRPIKKDNFLTEALSQYEKQLEYALFQTYREPNRKIADDKNFASLLNCDSGIELKSEELSKAKQDIIDALSNLLENDDFISYLKSAKYIVSQRPLLYHFDRFNIKAIPDLIAFFENEPPHIFDWKVHTYGINSYDEQLISYAIALYKVAQTKPHADFPVNLSDYKIYDYRLTEYQLLHPERIKRDYVVDNDCIEEFSSKVSASIIEMYMTGCDKKYSQLLVENFPTTIFIDNCQNCPFIKICKQSSNEIRNKYLQN